MTAPISKRVREEAALILSATASSEFEREVSFEEMASSLGVSAKAARLANAAVWRAPVQWGHACDINDPGAWVFLFADCEALVREGWTP